MALQCSALYFEKSICGVNVPPQVLGTAAQMKLKSHCLMPSVFHGVLQNPMKSLTSLFSDHLYRVNASVSSIPQI